MLNFQLVQEMGYPRVDKPSILGSIPPVDLGWALLVLMMMVTVENAAQSY